MREAVNKSATHPVEGPGTDVQQKHATQPVEAPGAGPDVLPTRYMLSLPVLTLRKNSRVNQDLPLIETSGTVPQTSPESEESTYRETIRGVRSFMGWHQIPEFDSVSSADNNPFAGSRAPPTGKVSVKLLVDDWLCRKMEKIKSGCC